MRKRTKQAVARTPLRDSGTTSKLSDSFSECQEAIAQRATLANQDSSKRLFVYIDASNSNWSDILA